MNSVDFVNILESPSDISSSATVELGELVKQFPYFQSAHLLYLKGLHHNKSLDYPKQLKVTAAYASDRKKLYELIMREDLHDIRVLDAGERFRLTMKASQGLRVRLAEGDLDGDLAIEPEIGRQKDRSHASGTDPADRTELLE